MNKTIATLTAVVALTLAACTTTASTTTTEDTRGWSDAAFRDLMAYCQAGDAVAPCASFISAMRARQCSVEGIYEIFDHLDNTDDREDAIISYLRVVLHPRGDCLGYTIPDETSPP